MSLSLALAWLAAHPFESLALIGAVLSVVNGALPASVQSGPVGRVLHAVLDRLAVLSRSDAAGTLKWPGVASALLSPVTVAPPSVGPLAPPVDPVAPPVPTPVEPSPVLRATTVSYRPSAPRETTAPPEVSDDHFEAARAVVHAEIGAPSKPSQGGHVEGAAMMGACVLALAASLLCAGCPLARSVSMRVAPGVPDPVGCVAGVQRCANGVPVVCSGSAREWPMLPRSASGEPRTCAPGACVVSDAGVAYCAPVATDGGAL